MLQKIQSLQNPTIKKIVQLQSKARSRKKYQQFVIEGISELQIAISAHYTFECILFCEEIISKENLSKKFPTHPDKSLKFIVIDLKVFQKIAYRQTTGGVIAIANTRDFTLDKINFTNSSHPLILVAEAPEKPGNIGALLRTAHAANLDAVFIANPNTDMYNPNIVRSSTGSLFKVPIAVGTTLEILEYLKLHNFTICTTALKNAEPYYKQDFTKKTAIVVGTEHEGLSNTWIENTDQNLVIPMRNDIDSLNVSVAAGIFVFEAVRQRSLVVNPLPL